MVSPNSADLDTRMEQLVRDLRRLDPLASVKGCSEEDISSAEQALGATLPTMYRTFLRRLGWRQGLLLRGSDVAGASELPDYQADARQAIGEWEPAVVIPDTAIVIAMHQGYRVMYLLPDGNDGPVFEVREGEREPRVAAGTFWEFLLQELEIVKKAIASQQQRDMD